MKFSNLLRQHAAALRALLVLTVILGIGYPVFIWLVAQLTGLSGRADGSLIEVNGKPVGSSLIGQLYTDVDGTPLPQYFQSRPSAAGDGYDPMSTSASKLLSRNLYVYGLGGIIAPFIGIKLIDLVVQLFPGM